VPVVSAEGRDAEREEIAAMLAPPY
jgi:hypothetical protein